VRTHPANENDLALFPREYFRETELDLIVDRAKKLNGAKNAEPDESVADATTETRQHRQRHIDFHPQDLPARDQIFAEQLCAFRRDDELGDTFDEINLFLFRAVLQKHKAGLAVDRRTQKTRGETCAIDLRALGVVRQLFVPAKRGAGDETRKLRIFERLAKLARFAGDHRFGVRTTGREKFDEHRIRDRTDRRPVHLLDPINLRRDVIHVGRRAAHFRVDAQDLRRPHPRLIFVCDRIVLAGSRLREA
jgi:hypothetical protein